MRSRALMIVVVLAVAVRAQAQPPKNVQVLTGLSRPEIWNVMNQMRAGLGVHCNYCHVAGGDVASDAKPQKVRGREMMRMVIDLNARHFGGRPVVTCFTCHNGKVKPALTPTLPQPVPPEPVAVEPKPLPAAAVVLQKYLAAVGREPARATPRMFKGSIQPPNGQPVKATIVYVDEKLRTDYQFADGSTLTRVLDTSGGWIRDKDGVRDMQPDEQVSVRLARRATLPFYTADVGADSRVVDSETIGDRNAWVVAGANARYWFDTASGFLLRRVVYHDSAIGRIPEQTDFDDYRDVGGVKLPFRIRVALVDPWLGSTRQADSIEIGVAVAPREFEKPSAPIR